MTIHRNSVFKQSDRYWIPRACFLILITVLFSACGQNRAYLYEAGERPIPRDIENQIVPHTTTQDDVLTLLGEPVARLISGPIPIWIFRAPHRARGNRLRLLLMTKVLWSKVSPEVPSNSGEKDKAELSASTCRVF